MQNQVSTFYKQLAAEVSENCDGLDIESYSCLAYYYGKLKNNVKLRSFYQYNWMRRIALMQNIITALPRRNRPWRILDAGCGVGTESIFWSTLRDDLEVIGVDINTERLNTAVARQKTYEMRLGRSLNIRFLEQDVFGALNTEHFDLVWVMEAISHIDPAEDFLSNVSKNLGSAGYLVISDSHILNPATAWRIYRLRRSEVAVCTCKTISTGETVSYAQERLFTVHQLSKMLKVVGFQSTKTQMSFFPLPQWPVFLFCLNFV